MRSNPQQDRLARSARSRIHCATVDTLEARRLFAVRIWDGGAVFGDAWSNANNWQDNVAPAAGDDLVFPNDPGVGSLDRSTRNDFAPETKFNSIKFEGGGYKLTGNALRLDRNGILSTATGSASNLIELNVTFESSSTIKVDGVGLEMAGVISGIGGFTKDGIGPLVLRGPSSNTYQAGTFVRMGRLILAKESGASAISHQTSIVVRSIDGASDAERARLQVNLPNQINNATNIRVQAGGELRVNANETIGKLDLVSSTVTGSGALTLSDTVSAGAIEVVTGTSTIDVPTLSLNNKQTTFAVPGQHALVVRSKIVSGGILKTGAGTLALRGASANATTLSNQVTGGTLILGKPANVAALTTAFTVGDFDTTASVSETARVLLENDHQLPDTLTVAAENGGTFDVGARSEKVDRLTLAGANMASSTGTLTVGSLQSLAATRTSVVSGRLNLARSFVLDVGDGPPVSDLQLDGPLFGGGDVELRFANFGTTVFNGTKLFAGDIVVDSGHLAVNGDLLSIDELELRNGTLTGTGRIRFARMFSDLLSAGSVGTPGLLHLNGLSLGTGMTFHVDLHGLTPITQHDQIRTTTGPVLIAGTILDLRPGAGFVPANGQSFRLLDNQGTGAVGGGFNLTPSQTIPNNSAFFIDGKRWFMNYAAGDGNDVVVTRNDAPAFRNRFATSPIREGGLATITGRITEENPGDTFIMNIDWGDGTKETFTIPPGRGKNLAFRHRYRDDGAYDAKLDWGDQFGGSNAAVMPIVVVNHRPILQRFDFASPPKLGRPATVTLGVRDRGPDDALKVLIDWGDGSATQTVRLAAGQREIDLAHTFAQSGRRTVTLTLSDDDGGTTVVSTRVFVRR